MCCFAPWSKSSAPIYPNMVGEQVHQANLAGLATLGSISVPSVQSVRSVHQCGQCTHFPRKTETFGGTREKKVHFFNAAEKRQKKALALASHQSSPSPVHMPTWDSNLHWQPMVKFGKKSRSWARTGDLRDLTAFSQQSD